MQKRVMDRMAWTVDPLPPRQVRWESLKANPPLVFSRDNRSLKANLYSRGDSPHGTDSPLHRFGSNTGGIQH